MKKIKCMDSKIKNIIIILSIILVIFMLIFIFDMISAEFVSNNDLYDDIILNENNDIEDQEVMDTGKLLYDTANEIYEVSILRPYCGFSDDKIKKMRTTDFGYGNEIKYYATNFKNMEDLKNNLKEVFVDKLIKKLIDESSLIFDESLLEKNKNYNYIIKDGKLYCRSHISRGWVSSYLNYYVMTPKSVNSDKIIYNIRSYYVTEDGLDDLKCLNGGNLDIHKCRKDEIEFKDTKFIIEKINDNWLVSDFTLHE